MRSRWHGPIIIAALIEGGSGAKAAARELAFGKRSPFSFPTVFQPPVPRRVPGLSCGRSDGRMARGVGKKKIQNQTKSWLKWTDGINQLALFSSRTRLLAPLSIVVVGCSAGRLAESRLTACNQ